MSKFHVGETLEVNVESLAYQGRGVGKKDGFVFFVPNTCPGDTVQIQIDKVKSTYALAHPLNILSSTNSRVSPPCAYAGRCGGCHWQHVAYKEQLIQKKNILLKAFSRFDQFNSETIEFVASPEELAYRNRIRLHWDGKKLGMFEEGTSTIIEIDFCKIAKKSVSQQIADISKFLKLNHANAKKNVDILENEYHLSNADKNEYPPFSQVNASVNTLIQSYVKEIFPADSKFILDLYCGEGNFTYFLSQCSPETMIIGVEANPESIARTKPTKWIKYINSDVEKYLNKPQTFLRPLTVVVDPPRSGCGNLVMKKIYDLGPDYLIYISCDPMTLVRDIKLLTDSGYQLVSVRGFDMFPQTYHLETIAMLKKQSKDGL